MRTRGVTFLSDPNARAGKRGKRMSKPAETYSSQIQILKSRGLVVPDESWKTGTSQTH